MSDISAAITALVVAAFGLAIVSVLVSKNAQTPALLQGIGSALGSIIHEAVSPVTGQTSVTGNAGLPMVPNFSSQFLSGNYG